MQVSRCICLSSNAHQLERHCLRTQTRIYTRYDGKALLEQALCIFLLKTRDQKLPRTDDKCSNPLLPFSPNETLLLFTEKKRNQEEGINVNEIEVADNQC